MIQISINKEIVKILREYSINSDYMGSVLIVLHCLYNEKYELLDELDKDNSDLLFLHVYKDLEMKFILDKTDADSNVHFKLTGDGMVLFQKILAVSKDKKVTQKKIIDLSWAESWIELWRDNRGLFYKSPSYSLGASSRDVKDKLIKFFANYGEIFKGLSDDEIANVILIVTEEYVKKEREKGFEYTRKSINYISKVESGNKGSDLAMACEEFINQLNKKPELGNKINAFNTSINNE